MPTSLPRWWILYGSGALAVAACEVPPRLHVDETTIATGRDVVVTFDDELSGRATNQYWIALQPVSATASDTMGRVVLERSERSVHLPTSRPGDFEVRLHGRYPKEDHHLLVRIPVKVDGWPVKTGIEQKLDAVPRDVDAFPGGP